MKKRNKIILTIITMILLIGGSILTKGLLIIIGGFGFFLWLLGFTIYATISDLFD